MSDLIERLEKATGPDENLDFAIWEAMGGELFCRKASRPDYTASIDAALTLAPKDRPLWSVAYDEDGVGGERSCIAAFGKGYHDPEFIYGHHKCSALALCIAALKARTTEVQP